MRATKEETNKTVINIQIQFIKRYYYTKKYQFDKMDLVICEQGCTDSILSADMDSVLMFKATPV